MRNNPIISILSHFIKFSSGRKWIVLLFVILSSIAQFIMLLQPLVIGKILNIIQESGVTEQTIVPIVWYLISILGIFAGFWIFHGPARILERKNAFFVRASYTMYLVNGILALSPKWHSRTHSGDTIDKIEKSTRSLWEFSGVIYELVELVVRLSGSFIILIYYDIRAAIPVLIVSTMIMITVILLDARLNVQYKQLNQKENNIAAQIFDTISNITTVIIIRIEKLLSKEILHKVMDPLRLYTRNVKLGETKWAIVSMLSGIMLVWVLLGHIFHQYKLGAPVLVGTLYILFGYIDKISAQFFRFTYRYSRIVRWNSAIESMHEVSDLFKDTKKKKIRKLSTDWKKLEIKDLSFSYEEDDAVFHLDKLNISVNKGERIAFIGESGSGKTTMLKILRGLYKPQKGNVYVDGVELKSNFAQISKTVTLIPQEPEIFTTTIKGNITMGVSYPKKVIQKFVRMARFNQVASCLPNKLDTNVMEKGVSLSGGEKQRLALARGLLAVGNSEFILLDEPTSSVDAANELEIYKNIYRNFKGRTIISTVHNLSLLPLFDTIYIFRSGKIIARGSFWDLMSNSKSFKRLWEKHRHGKK